MATTHVHRLIQCVPTEKLASTGVWYQANLDPTDDLSQWPTLNPTGLWSDPPTYSWSNGAFTDAQIKTIINKVCQMSGVTPPTGPVWNGWTKAQKYTWLQNTRNTFFVQSGIWLDLADNEATWDDPTIILNGLELKPRYDPTKGPI
jgi:hypothetical protein